MDADRPIEDAPTHGTGIAADGEGVTLRLLCPQWQGAGTSSVRALASEFPFDVARRGYAVGSAVLGAILPPGDGPTAVVPVTLGDEGLDLVDGVEAKTVVVDQLARALDGIAQHTPARIATLGGECAASVAPFSFLARRYDGDLAVLWMLGLGAVPDGLSSAQVRRIIADVTGAADVVGLTIAELFPRQVMHLQQILQGLPLISTPVSAL